MCIRDRLSVVLSQEVVQLGDQAFHSRNELDQALRDQYRTEVITLGGTFSHDTSHVSNDIVQRHILLLNLLGDDTNVRLSQMCIRDRTYLSRSGCSFWNGAVKP